jgi:hypothetical protein
MPQQPTPSISTARPDLVIKSAHVMPSSLPTPGTKFMVTVRNAGKADAKASTTMALFVGPDKVVRVATMKTPAIAAGTDKVVTAIHNPRLMEKGEMVFLADAPVTAHPHGQVNEVWPPILATSDTLVLSLPTEANNVFVMPFFPDKDVTVNNPLVH